MRFESFWFFSLLLVLPFLFAANWRRRGQATLTFSSTTLLEGLQPSLRQRLAFLPSLLRMLAMTALIVALARPQEGRERVHDFSKGVAIMMVIDRSGSMGGEMVFEGKRSTKLEVVKHVFEEFVLGKRGGLPGRPHDLIGMVAFARYPETLVPLTLAHGAFKEFLKRLTVVTRREEDGTAIGDAIALAAARLKTAEEALRSQGSTLKDTEIKSKVMILLTDGQHNAGKRTPLEATQLAKEWGIKIHAIGIGGEEGILTIQTPFGPRMIRTGEGVDKASLKAIAETTGGIFRVAEDADALRAIYAEIDAMEKSEVESVRYRDYRELFQPWVLAAIVLLLAEVWLNATYLRRIP